MTPDTEGLTSDGRSDWGWLTGEIRAAAQAFSDQLRSIDAGPGSKTMVPGLEWDARDLAAHLVSLPGFYRTLNRNSEPMEHPDDFAQFSRSIRAHLDDLPLAELADRLIPETESLLDELGDGTGRWMLYLETTAAKTGVGYLGELLLHGRDLTPLTGRKVAITPRHAHPWIDASMTLAPYFVDPVAAERSAGRYHIKIRGGRDYTMQITDGVLTTGPGRPERADGRMSADPVAYMLVTMGRLSDIRAGLTGKVVVYGRKPWKFATLSNVTIDGI